MMNSNKIFVLFKRFIFFTIFFSLVQIKFSFGQTEIGNFIGGSFGGSDFHIKDEHASPLIFSSIGIASSIVYKHKGTENRHFFEASYFYNYLATSADNFHTNNHRGKLRYTYLHSISSFSLLSKETDFLIGGSITTFLCHSDYFYDWNPGTARSLESWYWSNSLDLSAQLEYTIDAREFFSIQFSIPIVSNISRPKYSTSGDYNYIDNDWKLKMFGETKFFPKNFSIDAIISYQHPVIWNFNFQLSYEFSFSFYDKPQDLSLYMNNLRAGLFFYF